MNVIRRNEEIPEEIQMRQTIHVQEYTRAPNRTDRCIFNNCHNETRCRIPRTIVIHMLCEHRLYIPGGARTCREHLESNEWNELSNHCDVSHEFDSDDFTDVFSRNC